MGRALTMVMQLLVALVVLVHPFGGGQFAAGGGQPNWLNWIGRTSKRTLVQEYDLINYHLVKRVQNNSPDANLAEAANLLKEYRAGKRKDLGKDLPSDFALVIFLDLNNLLDPKESHCDLFARNILLENEKATASEIFKPINERLPLRRVGMVIYQVAYQHAEQCFHEYPRKFAEIFPGLWNKQMGDLTQMMQAIISTKELHIYGQEVMDKRQVDVLKARLISVTGQKEAAKLRDYLRAKTRHTEEEAYLHVSSHPLKRNHLALHDNKVVVLIEKFIYNRCLYLLQNFESILKPAELDLKLFQPKHRYRPSSNKKANFMLWFEYYRLCNEMEKNSKEVEDAVIKSIWDELGK